MSVSNKRILFDASARAELLSGVDALANAVKVTMGPSGQNVVIEQVGRPPILTKDGVTVARSINLRNQFENLGVQMVKEAASRTAETAGDGTTTATVLTQAMFKEGLKLIAAGYSSSELRRGMQWAVDSIIENLKSMAVSVSSDKDIINVGTISANGDKQVGKLLATAMAEVGRDGIITVEEAKGFETNLDIVDGLQLDRGYISPYFVTNSDKLVCELDNPLILLVNKTISNVQELLPLLEEVHRNQRDLMIIADDVDGDALKALVVNHLKGVLKVCVIRAPEFGESRVESFRDLSLLFSTDPISSTDKLGKNLADLGKCKKAEIYRNKSIFIECAGEEQKIEERCTVIREMISDPSSSEDEKSFLMRRLGRLAGGVAVLRVGGSTGLEVKEKRDRVEDALHATQAAVEEGILPGGGVALVRGSNKLEDLKNETPDFIAGVNLIKNACGAPLWQIVNNAGESSEIVLHKIMKISETHGYDARSGKYVNMMKSGIIDPLKVVRSALEHANSTACSLLSVGCTIIEEDFETDDVKTLIENA